MKSSSENMNPMTEDYLAAIEACAAAATPGPWWTYIPVEFSKDWRIAQVPGTAPAADRFYIGRLTSSHDPKQSGNGGKGLEPPTREDAAFIAAARAYVPALVAEVRRLQGDRDGWKTSAMTRGAMAEALAQAMLDEREACAKIAENGADYMTLAEKQERPAEERLCTHGRNLFEAECGDCIAAAIRARGKS